MTCSESLRQARLYLTQQELELFELSESYGALSHDDAQNERILSITMKESKQEVKLYSTNFHYENPPHIETFLLSSTDLQNKIRIQTFDTLQERT